MEHGAWVEGMSAALKRLARHKLPVDEGQHEGQQ